MIVPNSKNIVYLEANLKILEQLSLFRGVLIYEINFHLVILELTFFFFFSSAVLVM